MSVPVSTSASASASGSLPLLVGDDVCNIQPSWVWRILPVLSWWQWLSIMLCVVRCIHFIVKRYAQRQLDSLYWIWDDGSDETEHERVKISTNPQDMKFTQDFLFGVATSAHQMEGRQGGGLNNWSIWEKMIPQDKTTTSTDTNTTSSHYGMDTPSHAPVRDGSLIGDGLHGWTQWETHLHALKQLGVNSYRFSVEWSKVQPNGPGEWNEVALAHYERVLDSLLVNNITPMITLHHFTLPAWFIARGSFESQDLKTLSHNMAMFINFAKMIYERLGPGRLKRLNLASTTNENKSTSSACCTLFCTFHDPFFFVFYGWMTGISPPGKKDPVLTGNVLRNVLATHLETYRQLKELELRDQVPIQVGLSLSVFLFDAWNILNPFDTFMANYLNSLFHGVLLDFLQRGRFKWKLIGYSQVLSEEFHHDTNGSKWKCLDWIGLNYHSHAFVRFKFNLQQQVEIVPAPGSLMTDASNACIYPEGLFRSLSFLSSTLGLPLYVTENGLADANDSLRHLYIRRHIYALSRAVAAGLPVKGYFYYTLADCFEWNEGLGKKFGLFKVRFTNNSNEANDDDDDDVGDNSNTLSSFSNQTQSNMKLILKDGSKFYRRICKHFATPQFKLSSEVESILRSQLSKNTSVVQSNHVSFSAIDDAASSSSVSELKQRNAYKR